MASVELSQLLTPAENPVIREWRDESLRVYSARIPDPQYKEKKSYCFMSLRVGELFSTAININIWNKLTQSSCLISIHLIE